MKKSITLLVLFGLIMIHFSCSTTTSSGNKKVDLSDEQTKFSYAIGLDIGNSLKQLASDTELDLDALSQGIRHFIAGEGIQLAESEAAEIRQKVFTEIQEKHREKQKESAGTNAKEEEEFLAKNKEKEGIITTESGLQYEVITKGSGDTPTATDRVKVHYKGTLLDGTEFDSSYKRGEPTTFGVTQVIPGWTEALQLMQVGAKYKAYIPSKLGYGERGAGGKIGPNAMLIFEMELLGIEK